jgi:hypothetical protein
LDVGDSHSSTAEDSVDAQHKLAKEQPCQHPEGHGKNTKPPLFAARSARVYDG